MNCSMFIPDDNLEPNNNPPMIVQLVFHRELASHDSETLSKQDFHPSKIQRKHHWVCWKKMSPMMIADIPVSNWTGDLMKNMPDAILAKWNIFPNYLQTSKWLWLDDWPWGSQQQWLLHNQSLSPGTPLPSAAFCSLPGSRGLMFIQSTISSIRFYSFVVYKNLQFFTNIILHESKSSVHFSRGKMHMEETRHRNTNLTPAMVNPMPFMASPSHHHLLLGCEKDHAQMVGW